MNYKIVTKESFKVCGLQTRLTTSQSENYKIITKHWKYFNNHLKLKKIKFESDWLKYGITKKENDEIIYLAAIPKKIDVEGFTEEELIGGNYVCFEHKGNMNLIKSTIHEIYKHTIPELDIKIDNSREIIHYEQYDHRFLWNKPSSIIEINVPIENI